MSASNADAGSSLRRRSSEASVRSRSARFASPNTCSARSSSASGGRRDSANSPAPAARTRGRVPARSRSRGSAASAVRITRQASFGSPCTRRRRVAMSAICRTAVPRPGACPRRISSAASTGVMIRRGPWLSPEPDVAGAAPASPDGAPPPDGSLDENPGASPAGAERRRFSRRRPRRVAKLFRLATPATTAAATAATARPQLPLGPASIGTGFALLAASLGRSFFSLLSSSPSSPSSAASSAGAPAPAAGVPRAAAVSSVSCWSIESIARGTSSSPSASSSPSKTPVSASAAARASAERPPPWLGSSASPSSP